MRKAWSAFAIISLAAAVVQFPTLQGEALNAHSISRWLVIPVLAVVTFLVARVVRKP
jgi:hypothetical protein